MSIEDNIVYYISPTLYLTRNTKSNYENVYHNTLKDCIKYCLLNKSCSSPEDKVKLAKHIL